MNFIPRSQHLYHINIAGVLGCRKKIIKWSRLIRRFPTVLLIFLFLYILYLLIYNLQLALFISNVVHSLYILYIPLILLYMTKYCVSKLLYPSISNMPRAGCQRHCRQLMEHLVILELIRYIDEKRRYCADTSGMTGSAACRCLRTCLCRSSW